jgi:transglutaminase-like putative cysteine protease
LKAPYGGVGLNYYGTSLLLGQSAAQGDTPVFTVNVLQPPSSSSRYYWRGRVYDTYGNGDWASSIASNLDFDPGSGNLRLPDTQGRSQAQFRFTMQFPTQSLIYSPAEPVWLDRPAYVQITPLGTGLDDVLSWQAKRSISQGSQYQVRAVIGNPGVPDLRAAGTDYPAWVRTRYLQVPNSIRGELQALAERVTAGQPTPYDKAAAVTSYLRINLQYVTTVPPAPEGRDPIEWVLFDYKKGFCNYYASAEVLMLRTLGVPARLAVGFAQGQLVNGTYVVRRQDAHAWPEVFFPGLGWVEFEPTTAQQPLVRRDSTASQAGAPFARPPTRSSDELQTPTKPDSTGGSPAVPFAQTPVGRFAGFSLAALAAAALLAVVYRYGLVNYVPIALSRAFETTGLVTPAWVENWLRWNSLQPVEQAFASVNWSLRWLGKPPAMDATAVERAAALKALLPRAAESIEAVAAELEIGLFTAGVPDVRRARRAGLQVLAHFARARLNDFLGL